MKLRHGPLYAVAATCIALIACVSDSTSTPLPTTTGDAGSDAQVTSGSEGGTADAGSDAAPKVACDPTQPFGNITAVTSVNSSADEVSARISADGLSLYIASTRAGGAQGANVWLATRAQTTADFDPPQILGTVSTDANDSDPTISRDGNTLYLSSRVATVSSGSLDIFGSTLKSGEFGPFSDVAAVDSTSDETGPYLLPSALYLASNKLGGAAQIFRAPLGAGSAPGAPVSIFVDDAEAGAADALDPVPLDDERTMYIGSTRMDPRAKGQEDIWVTTAAVAGGAYAGLAPVAELDTSSREWPSSVSPDGCTIYFISDRGGNLDVWRADKPALK